MKISVGKIRALVREAAAVSNKLNHNIPYSEQLDVLKRRKKLVVRGNVGDPYFYIISMSAYKGDTVIDASMTKFKPGDRVVVEYSRQTNDGPVSHSIEHIIDPVTGYFEESRH